MPDTLTTDLLVVGAGPAGLYAAYYAGFRGLSVTVVDSLTELGGQITALYPSKDVFDVAGFPSVRGKDLVTGLVTQAAPFSPTYLLGETCLSYQDAGDAAVVRTSSGKSIRAKAVVVTGGIGTFTPRPLPGGDQWLGRGLVHHVPDYEPLRGQRVVVVGGGDSAVDWGLGLEGIATSVTLAHRREQFRAHAHSVKLLGDSSVDVLTPWVPTGLRGGTHLEAIALRHARTKEERVVSCDTVVAALGFVSDIAPLAAWGIELAERHVVVDTRMATNLPRVFAAGDITEYPGKVRLISVGFGEAATAVNNAATVIEPGALLFPGHSTETGAEA